MDIPQTVLGSLPDTDKQEYEIWEELLSSRGYKLLVEWLNETSTSVQYNIEYAPNWDTYLRAQGQRDGLNLVLNLEAILQAKVTQIAEELEAAANAEPDDYDELSVNLGLSQ